MEKVDTYDPIPSFSFVKAFCFGWMGFHFTFSYNKNLFVSSILHVFKFEYRQKPLFFKENPAKDVNAGFSLKKLKSNSIFEGKSGTGRAVSGIHKIEAISGSLNYLLLNNRLHGSTVLIDKKQGKKN